MKVQMQTPINLASSGQKGNINTPASMNMNRTVFKRNVIYLAGSCRTNSCQHIGHSLLLWDLNKRKSVQLETFLKSNNRQKRQKVLIQNLGKNLNIWKHFGWAYHSRIHWRWYSCLQLVTWKEKHISLVKARSIIVLKIFHSRCP